MPLVLLHCAADRTSTTPLYLYRRHQNVVHCGTAPVHRSIVHLTLDSSLTQLAISIRQLIYLMLVPSQRIPHQSKYFHIFLLATTMDQYLNINISDLGVPNITSHSNKVIYIYKQQSTSHLHR